MDSLTATALSEVLQEPEKALLARVLKILGQERCAALLAETLSIESNGGMLTRAGDRRRTPGGVFFQLVKNGCTGRQRYALFAYLKKLPPKRPASRPDGIARADTSTADATLAIPLTLTLDLWKGLKPMAVTATLKLVLRDVPETRERDGMVYMALHNEPRGLPKGVALDDAPLYLTAPAKMWRTACTKATEIRTNGTPALLIVEAHVSTREGALIGVVKGVQVVEAKAPVAPTA
jgi:hypothetical protein